MIKVVCIKDFSEFPNREEGDLEKGNIYYLDSEGNVLLSEEKEYVGGIIPEQLQWFISFSEYRELRINEILND